MEKTKLNLPLPLPLYRGIAVEGPHVGKMIEGSALYSVIGGEDDISIMPPEEEALAVSVRPETLGMYIGAEDMNGKNIFTGDVLKTEFRTSDERMITEYYLVAWDKPLCSCLLRSASRKLLISVANTEVIDNIHENPELLKLFPHLQGE